MDRRYDIDWIRVIVLGLLIVYHAVASFMPFAKSIFMPQNEDLLLPLWIPMALINIWRIPILFMISGMGIYFAMQRRNWKEMLNDRIKRIFVPMFFGFLFIGPLTAFFSLLFYDQELTWYPNLAHLWFLLNIWFYFCALLPLFVYLQNRPHNFLLKSLQSILSVRFGIYIFSLPFLLEALVIDPHDYASYASTPHGWVLGLICFVSGFIFVSLRDYFWNALEKIKSFSLVVAFSLYMYRLLMMELYAPSIMIAFESFNWMIVILGYSAKYLNQPSKRLGYLSAAVYPIYIIHMPMQYFFSLYILPLPISALMKFTLLVLCIFGVSFTIYESMIRRINLLRPLFGLKLKGS